MRPLKNSNLYNGVVSSGFMAFVYTIIEVATFPKGG